MKPDTLAIAEDLIDLFESHRGKTQGELNQQLQVLEGEDTDYRVKRGLAHILRSSFSTFEPVSPLEPPMLRERAFALASSAMPSPAATQRHLQTLANQLTQELDRAIDPADSSESLCRPEGKSHSDSV